MPVHTTGVSPGGRDGRCFLSAQRCMAALPISETAGAKDNARQMCHAPTSPDLPQVKAALETAYAKLGVNKALVGTLGARTSLRCDGSKGGRW